MRRRLWRPEDHTISRKMFAILVIPVVLLLGLAGVVMAGSAVEALDARRLVALADVSSASGELASRLSDERSAAAIVLLGSPEGFDAPVKAADSAVAKWQAARGRVSIAPGEADAALRRAYTLIAGLADLRKEVRSGEHAALSVVVLRYQLLIAALLDVRQGLVLAGAPVHIAERARAAVALSQAGESAGLLQVGVLRATAMGSLTPAAAAQISAARAGWTEALQVWDAAAPAAWRGWLDQAMSGEQLLAVQRLDGTVTRTVVGERLSVPRDQWIAAQTARQQRVRQVVGQADAGIVELLTEWGRQRTVAAITTGLITAGLLLAALWLASFVARRTVRSLVGLREQAMSVAQVGLPEAVAALARQPYAGDFQGRTPAEFFGVLLPVKGADEVADVTTAFNAVQSTAVDLAVGQVRARDRVTGLIVDLGRRQQVLVDRLISSIDSAERDEQDSDRLARLFAIDHLATRMRRATTNLLLLGGVPAPVTRDQPESLSDVLMAAISQVEGYQRVTITQADADVQVRAAAITQVVQALTELIDNAVGLSSEGVQVTGRRLGDRVVIEVIDSGIGMSVTALDDANRLLAGDSPADVPILRTMGLQVVAKVAAEQGIAVRLRHSEPRGITAEVIVPHRVLQPVSHRRVTAAPNMMAPRLMDRLSGDAPPWPPIAQQAVTAELVSTTAAGLPARSRQRPGVTASVPAAPETLPRRESETRFRALSSLQRGTQSARSGRRSDSPTRGE